MARSGNRNAIVSLIFARVIYAVNWYNIGSIFSLIALDFGENVAGLGFVTGGFYLGLGLGQVPGGILAARIGPRKTAIYGTIISSLACLFSGLISGFYQIIVLRFLAGLGMALVFAPGVALIAKYFGRRTEGLGVGVYNAVFYLGGALGLFGWAILANVFGWRMSLVSSGALGLGTGIVMIFLLPRDDLRRGFSVKRSALKNVLVNRSLIVLGADLFMITGGASLVTAVMVYYMEGTMQVNPALAGLIAGLALLLALAASPLAGRNYDRHKATGKLLFLSGMGMGGGLMLAAVPNIYGATLSTFIVGFCSGIGTTIGFSAAREVKAGGEYEALAVGWVNSLQLYSGFVWPVIFSYVVVLSSYVTAWLVAGICTVSLAAGILIWQIRGRDR